MLVHAAFLRASASGHWLRKACGRPPSRTLLLSAEIIAETTGVVAATVITAYSLEATLGWRYLLSGPLFIGMAPAAAGLIIHSLFHAWRSQHLDYDYQ